MQTAQGLVIPHTNTDEKSARKRSAVRREMRKYMHKEEWLNKSKGSSALKTFKNAPIQTLLFIRTANQSR